MADPVDLPDLKRHLANSAEALALDLFGQPAKRARRELRWGRKESLVVTIDGPRRGSFRSWEADVGGSMLDAIAFACSCSFKDAVDRAKRWLGEDDLPALPRRPARPVIPDIDAEEEKGIAEALRIVREAAPIAGTPGEVYLHGRAIRPREWPDTVRWHRHHGVVFVSSDPAGSVTAIQRVYVNADGTPRLDENGDKIKRSRGPRRGGAVHLDGDATGPLCLAEGPETALSVWHATGYETRAALGSIASVDLTGIDRTIIICADDDARNAPSNKGLNDAIRRWRREGRTVLKALPRKLSRRDKGDFNDALVEEGADAVRARVDAVLARPDRKKRSSRIEAIKMLAREMDAAITDLRGGADMLCLKVGFGLGKTREALRKAVQIIAEGEPVVYAVPTHKLSEELLQRAEKEARDQKVDVRIEVWRGRERDDPDGGTMCRDIDAVRDVQGVGGDPQTMVCRREINETVLECTHFKTCGYQKQRRKSADIWLVAHHALFSRKLAAISAPSMVIIDEGFWSAGLRGVLR